MDEMRTGAGKAGWGTLVTCEHASNDLPSEYGDLGVGPETLASHVAWDPGARTTARHCLAQERAAYHEGSHSRLLVDLNRSPHNPRVIPRESFGVEVPGNRGIDPAERRRRLRLYHEPYWTAVAASVRDIIAAQGTCLHISVHTFTPSFDGAVRRADAGLLYDPRRGRELALSRALAEELSRSGWRVRRNHPYRGTADGLTTHLRRLYREDRYLGIELELNQGRFSSRVALLRAAKTLGAALGEALVASEPYP